MENMTETKKFIETNSSKKAGVVLLIGITVALTVPI